MSEKGFAPIITLLVLVVLGALGYFAYTKGYISINLPKPSASVIPSTTPNPFPTTDPTANWKTYTSMFQGFSFKIPNQFIVSETKNGIEVFLNQGALDKSKVCKPDPKDIEPLPCSPFLFSIFYTDVPKGAYKSGEDYVNQVRGGMGGDPPYRTINGQGLSWVAGQASGLELRPVIRAFAYDKDKLRFVETNTYVLPFWEYINNLSSNSISWSEAFAQTDWTKIETFSYQVLSTFKFTQ